MRWAVGLLLLLAPGAVFAQGNPGNPADTLNNPHPTMPWTGPTHPGNLDSGDVVRYIRVAPRQLTIELAVPTPEGLPRRTQRQVVEVPGYVIAETTTGFYYPERWTLERLNAGVYQWRKLPARFHRK